MGYERYPRGTTGSYYNRDEQMDYGQDYGSGREGSYSSARDYEGAGEIGGDRDTYGTYDRTGSNRGYGNRNYGGGDYGNRDQGRGGFGARNFGGDRSNYGNRDFARDNANRNYGREYGTGDQRYARDYGSFGGQSAYGAYGSDNQRFGGQAGRGYDRDRDQSRSYGRDYGRAPQGYDYQDRGFFDRAGDEVRSWFGDDEAERRRRMDQRYDQQSGGQSYYGNRADQDRDSDYGSWRSGQIAALDRDYDEYRSENRQKFHNEFSSWRTDRNTQRDSLSKVTEHMDVVGSDDAHVGTVDKVRGDRIILTKSDQDAGGRHHSIPSRWIESVDDKVKLRKTADEAHSHWRDEERNQALFSENADQSRADRDRDDDQGRTTLNKSFSGTY